MTDPRRIAAHLAEELAAVGAPVPAHDERFDGHRLVVVCDVPGVVTFGTDGSRIWWQVRGRAHRRHTCAGEGGLTRARDALVRAVHAKQAVQRVARDRADDGRAAWALAADLTRLLPDGRVAVADEGPWPVTVRLRTSRAAAAVQVAAGWYTWPDPAPDLTWHLVGLRRCLWAYRHIAVTRLLALLRAQTHLAGGVPIRPAGWPPDRPDAVA